MKKENIVKYIRGKIDYSKEKIGKCYTFQGDASFSDCQLPYLSTLPKRTRSIYQRCVLDEEKTSCLKNSHTLNRFPQTIQLHALSVPKDGNGLLHSVSTSVWSVADRKNTLRELLFISLRTDLNFQKRWRSQQLNTLHLSEKDSSVDLSTAWDDLMNSLSDSPSRTVSNDISSRYSDSLYIYVLANILRRPIIIVKDNQVESVNGHNYQNDDIGGVYLPLEWEPIECCKTPVIIGYSLNQYFPLVSEADILNTSQLEKKDPPVFPLVNSDLGGLLIRYLTEDEASKAWELLQCYLLVKEQEFHGGNDSLIKVPCAEIKLKPLETNENLLYAYLNVKKSGILRSVYKFLHPTSKIVQKNSQTEESSVRLGSNKSEQLENSVTDITTDSVYVDDLKNYNPEVYVKGEDLYNEIYKPSNTSVGERNRIHLTLESRLNNTDDHPLTPTAPPLSLEAHPFVGLYPVITDVCGNMLSNNIYPNCHECSQTELQRNNSVSPCLLTPVKKRDESFVELTRETISYGTTDHALTPTAPFPTMEPESCQQLLSMMDERCKNGCGYRCSNQTYPYCHECYQTEIQTNKQQGPNNIVASAPPQSLDIVAAESSDKSNSPVLTTRMYEPGVLDLNITNQSILPLVISSPGLHSKSQSHNSSENSLFHTNEQIGSLYKAEKIANKGWEDQNGKNIEQKMHSHLSDDLSEIKETFVTPHQKLSSESNRSKMVATNSSPHLHSENNTNHFAGTVRNIISCDTEFSVVLTTKVKCISPYCCTLVSGPDELCSKCQDVLRLSSSQTLPSQSNVDISQCETDKKLQTVTSQFDSNHKEMTPVPENKFDFDSCIQHSPPCRTTSGISLSGALIQQASDETQILEPSCQEYGKTDKENANNSNNVKSNSMKSHQTVQETIKKQENASLSSTFTRENNLCKDTTFLSSHNKNITAPHEAHSNNHFDLNHSSTIKTEVLASTASSAYLATSNPSGSPSIQSNKANEMHPPYDSHSSKNHLPSSAYPSSVPSFKHFEETSSSMYSLQPLSFTFSDPEQKSAIVTSMTKRMPYKNWQQSSTKSSYDFHPATNTNSPYNFQTTENTWKISAPKCVLPSCSNYGNTDKEGYCNNCYKIIRTQRILYREATRGVDVPDCGMLVMPLGC
uniref:ubiquitinyl hydrolase 1 n=1 Tax=Arion vulgaris TaxID=1028688 RepID=A0A0B7B034_9EUPU